MRRGARAGVVPSAGVVLAAECRCDAEAAVGDPLPQAEAVSASAASSAAAGARRRTLVTRLDGGGGRVPSPGVSESGVGGCLHGGRDWIAVIGDPDGAGRRRRSPTPVLHGGTARGVECGTIAAVLISQLCTLASLDSPRTTGLVRPPAADVGPRGHRSQAGHRPPKDVGVALRLRGAGRAGHAAVRDSRGLGFGVGREPLVALFASLGCEVMATDLEPERAERPGGPTPVTSTRVVSKGCTITACAPGTSSSGG